MAWLVLLANSFSSPIFLILKSPLRLLLPVCPVLMYSSPSYIICEKPRSPTAPFLSPSLTGLSPTKSSFHLRPHISPLLRFSLLLLPLIIRIAHSPYLSSLPESIFFSPPLSYSLLFFITKRYHLYSPIPHHFLKAFLHLHLLLHLKLSPHY